jgi:general secretion pathway protein E
MLKIIEMLLEDKILEKEKIVGLIRTGKAKKVTISLLIENDMLDKVTLERFLADKVRAGKIRVSDICDFTDIDKQAVLKNIAAEMKLEFIDLDDIEIDASLVNKVPFSQLVKYSALPIKETDLNVVAVLNDPFDIEAHDALQRLFPLKPLNIAIASPKLIIANIQRLETQDSVKNIVADIRRDLKQDNSDSSDGESSSIVKLIDIILKSAIYAKASDIHVEALEKSCIVRERVDGLLRQSFTFDKDMFAPLSSRMKLLANLDIAEKRKPQDGRFSATVAGKPFDFRASTLPTMFGESIVLRILDKTKVMIRLDESGMSKHSLDRFSEAIKVPYGIVLVTGPTGSGKTTTLYGAINAIRDVHDKIITVEDPVEYQMSGIQQVQVNAKAGLGFSDALRSILRQDPDKIMIGEIRDSETLRIAVQAALTGHLVLSTLHTNDSISAISRILDMGIETYLVSGALVCIQAQRLVRKICPNCKAEVYLPDNIIDEIKVYLDKYSAKPVFYKGVGCKECSFSGYQGREMISEVLTVSEEISRMIASNATKEQLTIQATSEGFITMFEDGIIKAIDGKTTIDEIYRVARL